MRENPSSGFPTRSDTNRPIQSQKQARSFKFRIYEEEKLHYPCSENKGADQLRSYCEADLRLSFSHVQKSGFLTMRLIFDRLSREKERLQSDFDHLKEEHENLEERHQRFIIQYGHDGSEAQKGNR